MRQCWAKCQFRKNCITPSYQYRFTPGRYGLFLDRGLGRNLIWEFCILEVPKPQRSVVCPLRRPLIGLHRDQQQGPHVFIQEAAHRLVRAGTLSAGIRWVIAFRKSLFFIWLVSPCPLDQVLILGSWCLWGSLRGFLQPGV